MFTTEWGHGKPRWKTSMTSNDAIHVQAKEGREVDDCLYAVHDVW